MKSSAKNLLTASVTLPQYARILVAIDASDHANQALREATTLASAWGSVITGTHVYAAKMHDRRFRQMEGGLPEAYRKEEKLEEQRDIHDELITRGLSAITDSYLEQAETDCKAANVQYRQRALEGKNYSELVSETNSGAYDLLIMGALGLGSVPGSRLGTVCQRVCRRSDIDTLVIKQPGSLPGQGPIVVAVDGSTRAYGGLLSAISLARVWGVAIRVVAAYDPYYHYVAFNRIAGILSEAAGKVFKFKQQEQLHEDIIDAGLAKIYQGHLDICTSIAADHGVTLESELLAGKPAQVLGDYVSQHQPSLLVVGKLGVHADTELDLGGNAEQLLRDVDCAVLLSQREYTPCIDTVAEVSISWTHEAEQAMKLIPSFVQKMARIAILRYAQDQGHTVITAGIVTAATARLCPAGHSAGTTDAESTPTASQRLQNWSRAAKITLARITNERERASIRLKAQKHAYREGADTVESRHVEYFLSGTAAETPGNPRLEINNTAQTDDRSCPFQGFDNHDMAEAGAMVWSDAAQKRLRTVPRGSIRDMARKATETIAEQSGIGRIDSEYFAQILAIFQAGSSASQASMEWDEDARAALGLAPEMINGMLIREIEIWAKEQQKTRIDLLCVNAAKQRWSASGMFHLGSDDPRSDRQGRLGDD